MNILPKKSWHVRNKKNIERVRRDEEKAAEEEKEKQRRIELAESEARSDALRRLASKRQEPIDEPECTEQVPKHINFFEHLELGEKVAKKNKQHEEEQKVEKEKHEKSIGLLTYLGQGSAELEDKKPWYCDPRSKIPPTYESDIKSKKHLDPLASMAKYKECAKKIEITRKGSTSEKNNIDHSPRKPKSKPKSIEQMRAERISREKSEIARQQQLINGKNSPKREVIYDERSLPYNSQFNPNLITRLK